MIRFTLYIAAFLALPACLGAQWKNVAPTLFAGSSAGYGALYYVDGVIWAGNEELWSSRDTGKTWRLSSYEGGEHIRDIYFLDKYNGLVGSESEGVFLTRDGGETWRQIFDGGAWEVSFNGSPDIIHVLTTAPGTFYTSMDGGATWTFTYLGNFGLSFAIARDHRIHAFSAEQYLKSMRGWVTTSTDYGATWSNRGAVTDGDSYTISVDSCDANRLYLVNEDHASTNDNLSEIHISTNAGLTWTPVYEDSGRFFSGNLATTPSTLYAGAIQNPGIYRSTDRGITWKSCGGPSVGYDSRNIFAINDNIVVAISENGGVWITGNSGGDSLTIIHQSDTIAGVTATSNGMAVVYPLDTAHVHVRCNFPSGSAINTIAADEITFTLRYNSQVLTISEPDLPKIILPPSGWSFKTGTVTEGSLSVTLANIANSSLNFDQDLGTVVMTALAAPLTQSPVWLERIVIYNACSIHEAFLGLETGHLRIVKVAMKDVDGEHSLEHSVSVYPNPASETLTLAASIDVGKTFIELFDETAKKHLALQINIKASKENLINVSNLPAGSYYLRISTDGRSLIRNLIINR